MGTYYGWKKVKVSTIGNTKKRYIAIDRVAHYIWQKYQVRLFVHCFNPHEVMAMHIGYWGWELRR